MHLKKRELVSMTCCKLLLPQPWTNSLFFPLSFPKFSITGTEQTPKFICGPGIAKLLPCSGSVGCSVLYSSSPQPVSWLCTAMLSLRVRRCAKTRGNPSNWQRKNWAHQPLHQSMAALQIDWKEDAWATLFSLTESRSQHVSWGALYTQETGKHSRGSPLLLTYHKASPWTSNCETVNENAIKDERRKLCTVKSKDTDSFFPSSTWKIRKLEASCKLNECLI